MVSLCCCFHDDEDPEGNVNDSKRGFIHTLFHKVYNKDGLQYAAIFHKEEAAPVLPAADNEDPSSNSSAQSDPAARIPPRILSVGISSGPFVAAGQLPRGTEFVADQSRDGDGLVLELDAGEHKSNECASKSDPTSPTVSKELPVPGICVHAPIDDECPTCLEEYSLENPRIVTQCNHHFHLSCIYEWMERRPTCPVCSKVMIFDETN